MRETDEQRARRILNDVNPSVTDARWLEEYCERDKEDAIEVTPEQREALTTKLRRGRWQMVCCETTLLDEIANPVMKRRDVAKTYGLTLCSEEGRTVDWRKINAAIMARWSPSGLLWIKQQAQKVAREWQTGAAP